MGQNAESTRLPQAVSDHAGRRVRATVLRRQENPKQISTAIPPKTSVEGSGTELIVTTRSKLKPTSVPGA